MGLRQTILPAAGRHHWRGLLAIGLLLAGPFLAAPHAAAAADTVPLAAHKAMYTLTMHSARGDVSMARGTMSL